MMKKFLLAAMSAMSLGEAFVNSTVPAAAAVGASEMSCDSEDDFDDVVLGMRKSADNTISGSSFLY